MLEAGIAIVGLVVGVGLGWWMHGRAVVSDDPEKMARLEDDLRAARDAEVEMRTSLDYEQKKFQEEKKRLEDIRKELENTFKAMAADIAKSNSETFLQQAKEQFNALKVNAEHDLDEKKKLIDKSLTGMNERLESIDKQSIELKTSIDKSQLTTDVLSQNTIRLREILSSSQKRGQWGERMVEDILQVIGLVENTNYTKQRQTESGERPDFTFLLPREKKVNMDVKFPLAHYENYVAAESDEVQEKEKTEFLRDVKKHIKNVTGRAYINTAEGTLDYVMLFIPNEAIYGFINREDTALVDHALKHRVLLCSPLTLYAVLSLIRQAVINFTMNEQASEVIALMNQFREQWKKYVEQMDKMGRRINGLAGDFHELTTTRTRALDKPLDKIENLTQTISDDTPKLLE